MKNLLLLAFCALSFKSFATGVQCKSANYQVMAYDIEDSLMANYAINGVANEDADVTLEQFYLTKKGLALSIEVDGQPSKFEVITTASGKDTFKGTLFTGKIKQNVTCTLKHI
jgi:hypothetical protein